MDIGRYGRKLRSSTLKLFQRKSSSRQHDSTEITLPQELVNQIVAEYHVSFPDEPLYPLLLAFPQLSAAVLPLLCQNASFDLSKYGLKKWSVFMKSLTTQAVWVRSLDIIEFQGQKPGRRLSLEGKEASLCLIHCVDSLSRLRSISIKCIGATLPVALLLAISKLPQLESLELYKVGFTCPDSSQTSFNTMPNLKDLCLINVLEASDDECPFKWSSFLQACLPPTLTRFEFFTLAPTPPASNTYPFLPLSLSSLASLRLAQPNTPEDASHLLALISQTPHLRALSFELPSTTRTWGPHITALGPSLPAHSLRELSIVSGPPAFVTSVTAGRPIHSAMIRWAQSEPPMLSTLVSLRMSMSPLRSLALWTPNLGEMAFLEIGSLFPSLERLSVFVFGPAVAPWAPQFSHFLALRKLKSLRLIGIDESGSPGPLDKKLEQSVVRQLFKVMPSLESVWLRVDSERWGRDGKRIGSASKSKSKSKVTVERLLEAWQLERSLELNE